MSVLEKGLSFEEAVEEIREWRDCGCKTEGYIGCCEVLGEEASEIKEKLEELVRIRDRKGYLSGLDSERNYELYNEMREVAKKILSAEDCALLMKAT